MEIRNFTQLKKLAKNESKTGAPSKVAVLGDTATQFLTIAIRGCGLVHGFDFEMFEADYGQIDRQILDKTSDYHQFQPEFTVVFESAHKLLAKFYKHRGEPQTFAEEQLSHIKEIFQSKRGKLIYFNFSLIDDHVFGNFSNKVPASFVFQLNKLNYLLSEFASDNPDFFIADLSSIQNKYGRDMLFSPNIYINSEMVLSIEALPIVAENIVKIIGAIKGKFKKCLILDLDNTLWGGIIGDDGIEKIQIGSLGIGKAFTELQYWAKALRKRGVILAVCSKNDEDKAKEPFEKHPDMVLKLEDIAVFVANWDNKADNIRKIQNILNIGFDSMVFLDDNPFERNIVRENLPEVAVPELPEDPALYLEHLYSLNLFETASYSENDMARTRQYQLEAQRASDQANFTNVEDFLKNLDMRSDVRAFDSFTAPRVSQLSQRSNQFNLRTVRYTEQDIQNLANDEGYLTLSFTLEDKYGDHGLICVVVLKKMDQERLFIENWFMSCRVLKRGMEEYTLNKIIDLAKSKGFSQIIGEYLPSPKNQMVENHYKTLGFSKQGRVWLLSVEGYIPSNVFIHTK